MNTPTRCVVMLLVFVGLVFVGVDAQEEPGLRQLTDDPAQDGFPSWHPDGHTILFSRYGRDVAPEKTGLWLVAPDGSEARRLTAVIGEHPDWSPDGRYIVYDGDFGNAIRLMSRSGGTPVRIVPEWIPVERGGQLRWSPDGTRVAFKEGTVLWVLELATGSFEKIFSEPGKRPIPTGWSADGSEIFVWLLDDETRRSDLWAVAVAGGSKRQVASEAEAVYRYADLSGRDAPGRRAVRGTKHLRHLDHGAVRRRSGPDHVAPGLRGWTVLVA